MTDTVELGGNEYVIVKNEPPQDVPQRSEDRPRAGLGGLPDPRMPAQDVGGEKIMEQKGGQW